jgi:hypothetical protein
VIFNYVDIGACDFETSLDKQNVAAGETVLLVEPVVQFLEALPNPPGVVKVCAAITATGEDCSIFHVSTEAIERYNMPFWTRGCSRLRQPHQGVLGWLQGQGINFTQALDRRIFQMLHCHGLTFQQLCDNQAIEKIVYLKIDTEGCDHEVLAAVYEVLASKRLPLIESIRFERYGHNTFDYCDDPYGNCDRLDELALQFKNTWGYEIDPPVGPGEEPKVADITMRLPRSGI